MRRLAILAGLLAITGAARAEERPAVRSLAIEPIPPFRCDSVVAQDCFDMYQRHVESRVHPGERRGPAAVKTVPPSEEFDRRWRRDDAAPR